MAKGGAERMAKIDVMVVEDEAIVAKDIQRQLTRFGYGVAAVVSSGEEAVENLYKIKGES